MNHLALADDERSPSKAAKRSEDDSGSGDAKRPNGRGGHSISDDENDVSSPEKFASSHSVSDDEDETKENTPVTSPRKAAPSPPPTGTHAMSDVSYAMTFG